MTPNVEEVNEVELLAEAENRISEILTVELPISRVKKICKMDPEVNMINHDAILMITKATELFVKEMAKSCYTQAVIEKRKTIQQKDLTKVIKTNWMFDFLEDALDGWPESNPKQRKTNPTETETVVDETLVETEDVVPESEDLPDTVPLTNEEAVTESGPMEE